MEPRNRVSGRLAQYLSVPILALLFGAIMCAVLGFLANTGYQHLLAGSKLWHAKDDFASGNYAQSVIYGVESLMLAVDSGARYTFIYIYTDPMHSASERGDLPEALNQCRKAVQFLSPYDDEGTMSYVCFTIEEKIQRGD